MSTEVDDYLAHMGLEVGDDLKHYGKKGMKWGVRNDDDGGSGGSSKGSGDGLSRKEKRKAANEEIMSARLRQTERKAKADQALYSAYTAKGEKEYNASMRKFEKMNNDLLNNPDAATAARLTSGEKMANVLRATAIVSTGAGLVALKVAKSR